MSARGGAPIQMALCQKVGNLRKMKCCGFDSDPQEMTDEIVFPLTLQSALFQWSLASLVMVYTATTQVPILIPNTRLT